MTTALPGAIDRSGPLVGAGRAAGAAAVGVAVGFYLGFWLGDRGRLSPAWAPRRPSCWSAATVITVDDHRLRVGRAMIELDVRRRLPGPRPGRDPRAERTRADARAYLVLRPYIRTRSR